MEGRIDPLKAGAARRARLVEAAERARGVPFGIEALRNLSAHGTSVAMDALGIKQGLVARDQGFSINLALLVAEQRLARRAIAAIAPHSGDQ